VQEQVRLEEQGEARAQEQAQVWERARVLGQRVRQRVSGRPGQARGAQEQARGARVVPVRQRALRPAQLWAAERLAWPLEVARAWVALPERQPEPAPL
jgi:hypothetical protein